MASECGKAVGKGTFSYPCNLPASHQGPCQAVEYPPSLRQRARWEQGEQSRRVLSEVQGKPLTFAENIGEDKPLPHPAEQLDVSKIDPVPRQTLCWCGRNLMGKPLMCVEHGENYREPPAQANGRKSAVEQSKPEFRRGADQRRPCTACKEGDHGSCAVLTHDEEEASWPGAFDGGDDMSFFPLVECSCYDVNPDQHEEAHIYMYTGGEPGEPEAPYRPEALIVLSGYAYAGKDSVADFLCSDHGFQRYAFSDSLKQCLYELDPIIASHGKRLKETVDKKGWAGAKKYPEVRRLMQIFGTEVARNMIRQSIWVDFLVSAIERDKAERVVITDCRFSNEAEAFRDWNAMYVRVERPGVEALNDHSSEGGMDDFRFDATIQNDGTLDDLRVKTAFMVGKLVSQKTLAYR